MDADAISDLVFRYGDATGSILEAHRTDDQERPLIYAELDYCIEQEMITGVADFLIRRTGKLFFERPSLEEHYMEWHAYITEKLQLTEEIAKQQLDAFHKEYEGVVAFRSKELNLTPSPAN